MKRKPERSAALSFRISQELKQELEAAAHDEDRSVSYIVERIIKEWSERRRSNS